MEKIKHPLKILSFESEGGIIRGSELPPQDEWMLELGWMSVFNAWEEEWKAFLVTRRIDCGRQWCRLLFPSYDCGVDYCFPIIFLSFLDSQLDNTAQSLWQASRTP